MIEPSTRFTLQPYCNNSLLCVTGELDSNLRGLESLCQVTIYNRGPEFFIFGKKDDSNKIKKIIEYFYKREPKVPVSLNEYKNYLDLLSKDNNCDMEKMEIKSISPESINLKNRTVVVRSENQKKYINAIKNNDLIFGVGPAGTGKTYLAVCLATYFLLSKKINKIILARPAVEAGEKLGFLPGDLNEKVDPFLKPLYDSLQDTLGVKYLHDLMASDVIEIAPLAYMRGRTLNDSFVILDEAQNTTKEQMKMFLTRLGEGSKMVITGDGSQIDIPSNRSGLKHSLDIISQLTNQERISIVTFTNYDVMRHPLVTRILSAYENYDK